MTYAGKVNATGHIQAITPARQRHAIARFEEAVTRAERTRTHLWTAVVMHMLGEHPNLEGQTLDADSIALPPMVSCFVCEVVWEPDVDATCPGDPQGRKVSR